MLRYREYCKVNIRSRTISSPKSTIFDSLLIFTLQYQEVCCDYYSCRRVAKGRIIVHSPPSNELTSIDWEFF